jgi:hypothetical protein
MSYVGRSGLALLLNNTATSYHWGCYATSMMLVDGITRQGFAVTSMPVEATHFGLVYPEQVDAIDSDEYLSTLKRVNPFLLQFLADSDVIIVNGEGTLHRFHPAPRGLLALMRFAKRRLNKPVILLNHSVFPSGTAEPADAAVETYYRECLSCADVRVAREDASVAVYQRLGLPALAGFDALPYFLDQFMRPLPACEPVNLIGAASHWRDAEIDLFADALLNMRGELKGPLMFLSGGYRREPLEDAAHFARLKARLPDLGILRPTSIAEWLGYIAAAKLFVTGRFHHLVAAAALGTPTVMMPGNTSKVTAVCDLIGFSGAISPGDADFADRLAAAIRAPNRTTSAQREMLVERAKKNLAFD